ncbi:MAG: deoxyribonuclease IV [Candidatus Eremiobacteraeota bacterium]|nr:deoxyribonuclease IV [Candidatus Eremiobacteraeota bacterium]
MRLRSGGYPKAVAHAQAAGCNALQIFSSNPRSYRAVTADPVALDNFARLRKEAGLDPCVIHSSYLVNLASDDAKIYEGSLRLLRGDLTVGARGGMGLVNTHLGSYGARDRERGFLAICRALEAALETIAPGVFLVLENSAGAGNLAGGTLDELGAFVNALAHPQLGVCLDTAHAWASGYAINGEAGVAQFLERADEQIGLDRVLLFHFNDTEVELGAGRDRHWHIGEGKIGFDGFRALLAHPALREKTAILETPGNDEDDFRNVATIRAIQKGIAR